ncbi:MAG: SPOR domain-containing protein [Sterolibacterium sp.]
MIDKATGESGVDPVDPQAADAELKSRLIRRVSVAVVLIVALLGGLAVLDALNAPPKLKPVEEAPVVAQTGQTPAETKPEEKPPEPAQQEETKKAEEVPAEPEKTAAPAAPNRVEHAPRPLTKPAEARQAMLKPSAPPTELVRPPRPAAPASRPLTQPLVHTPVFLLQLGVFNNTANAEELRAKLELNGIPSQIEARVQVGPFKSRQEAEQARDKLKQLGMETGLILAVKK